MSSSVTARALTTVPAQDRRRPAADVRVRAAAAVLAGEPVDEAAARAGVDVAQVLRWADALLGSGAAAVGGVGVERPTSGPHGTRVPVEDYLQVVAHELRTPLTAARAALSVLGRGDLPDTLRAQVADTVLHRLAELDQLTTDLLDVVSVASGQVPLAPERVDLETALHDACSTTGVKAPDAGPVVVHADPARLDRMLRTLLEHCHRYAPSAATAVGLRLLQDAALVTVRLDGVAVAPEDAQQAFDPFAASRGDGNGLALYVVRTLAVASGGQVGVAASDVPSGPATVFWLRLPLADPDHPLLTPTC